MSGAREEILERIAAAVGEPPPRPRLRAHTATREPWTTSERVELFCRRVGEYRSEVHRVDEAAWQR